MIYVAGFVVTVAYFLVACGYAGRMEDHGMKPWKANIGGLLWPVAVCLCYGDELADRANDAQH